MVFSIAIPRIPTAHVISVAACLAMLSLSASAQYFAARSQTTVLNEPLSIAVGDFNHDGKQDLAVADATAGVAILLGNGDGTFQTPVYYSVGVEPRSIAAADLNHDGILDLVVADYDGSGIYAMTGRGDGTFQVAQVATPTHPPTFVGLADVNGDKQLDLIVIDSPYVSIFLNQGNGTFGSSMDMQQTYVPTGVGWGDFDGSGTMDLAVAQFAGGNDVVTILLGNGDGTFRQGQSYPVDSDPLSVVVADFRGKGKLDLAVAAFLGDGIDVLLGNGDGTFQSPVRYVTPFPTLVIAPDLNGDGKPDLVAMITQFGKNNTSLSGAAVLLGNGDGTFQAQQQYLIGSPAWGLAVGDPNGDKKVDLAVGTECGDTFCTYVLLNTGQVRFSPTTGLNFPAQLIGTTGAPLTATVTNKGTTSVSITSVTLQGKMFSIKDTCSGTLSPGAHCTISAKFSPTVEGAVTGTVTIKDSASTKPQVLELIAAGTVVSFNPSSLTFPAQKVGTKSAPMPVQVTNTGNSPLDFTGITIRGDFTQTNTCGSQIGPGASCTINVTFRPTSTGLRTGSVTVNDDGGGSPQFIYLKGTGD